MRWPRRTPKDRRIGGDPLPSSPVDGVLRRMVRHRAVGAMEEARQNRSEDLGRIRHRLKRKDEFHKALLAAAMVLVLLFPSITLLSGSRTPTRLEEAASTVVLHISRNEELADRLSRITSSVGKELRGSVDPPQTK